MNNRQKIAFMLAMSWCFASTRALADTTGAIAKPATRPPAAEYYTTNEAAGLLIRVNIWGEVQKPGVHFVPASASIADSVSAAGGPLPTAIFPEVYLHRGGTEREIDILRAGRGMNVMADDTIVVQRSFKTELPLLYSTISAVISIAAFYLVMSRNKD